MEHEKFIYACNNTGCYVEFVHVYVKESNAQAFNDEAGDFEDCPNCGFQLVFCERINTKGETV